jgi:hypothetical protein
MRGHMSDIQIACRCGHEMRVSEQYYGTTQSCPRCGESLYISLSTIRPAPVDTAPAPMRPAPMPDAPIATAGPKAACSRCGRSFRGEWDVHKTPSGLLCHVCANQAAEVAPRDVGAAPPATVTGVAPRRIEMPETRRIGGFIMDEPRKARPKNLAKLKREALILGTLFVLTMAGIFFLPVEDLLSPGATDPAREVARAWGVVVMAIRLASLFAGAFIAYYVVLHYANKLPRETFLGNLIALGPVVAGLATMAILPFPAPIGAGLLTLYVCFFVYYLSFSEFVQLILLCILANILVAALVPLLYGLIALIAL